MSELLNSMVSSDYGGHQSKILWSSSLCHSTVRTSPTHHYTFTLPLSLLPNHQCYFSYLCSFLATLNYEIAPFALHFLYPVFSSQAFSSLNKARLKCFITFASSVFTLFWIHRVYHLPSLNLKQETSASKLMCIFHFHFTPLSILSTFIPPLIFFSNQLVNWPPCLPVTLLQLDTLSIPVTPVTHQFGVPNFNCLDPSVSLVQCPRLTCQGMDDSFPLNMPPPLIQTLLSVPCHLHPQLNDMHPSPLCATYHHFDLPQVYP